MEQEVKGDEMRLTPRQLRQIIKEELARLNESNPLHGISPQDVTAGKAFVVLRGEDPPGHRVSAVRRDFILLQAGRRIHPSQVDWPRTTGSKR